MEFWGFSTGAGENFRILRTHTHLSPHLPLDPTLALEKAPSHLAGFF